MAGRGRWAPRGLRGWRPGAREPDAATQGRPGGLRDDRRVLPRPARCVRRIPPGGGGMSDGYPAVIPMLAYEDGPAAMDWLARAFGFRERARMLGENGRLSHGEMEAGEGVIMLATPSPHYHRPKRHREESEDARKWSEGPYIIDGVLVYVDDVAAHFERARAAGP